MITKINEFKIYFENSNQIKNAVAIIKKHAETIGQDPDGNDAFIFVIHRDQVYFKSIVGKSTLNTVTARMIEILEDEKASFEQWAKEIIDEIKIETHLLDIEYSVWVDKRPAFLGIGITFIFPEYINESNLHKSKITESNDVEYYQELINADKQRLKNASGGEAEQIYQNLAYNRKMLGQAKRQIAKSNTNINNTNEYNVGDVIEFSFRSISSGRSHGFITGKATGKIKSIKNGIYYLSDITYIRPKDPYMPDVSNMQNTISISRIIRKLDQSEIVNDEYKVGDKIKFFLYYSKNPHNYESKLLKMIMEGTITKIVEKVDTEYHVKDVVLIRPKGMDISEDFPNGKGITRKSLIIKQ